MRINVISTYEEFLELENDWKYIFEKSGTDNIFVSWEWCSLWLKHYGQNQKLLILAVSDGEKIIGIAPLIVIRGNVSTLWKPIIRFIGGNIADYMDFLILHNNGEVVRAIINFLIEHTKWGIIDLRRFQESSSNLLKVRECIDVLRYPSVFRISGISPVVRIKDTWDDYYRSISKGLKQDIRTAHNKFKLLGGVSYDNCSEKTTKTLLDIFFQMHKKRQTYKVGQSLFDSERNRKFFHDLVITFTKSGLSDISTLRIKNRIISVVFALKYRDIFYFWIPAFDPEFMKYSTGKVHFYNLLRHCFEMNFKTFDFMRGDESYKLKWANETHNNYDVTIYNNYLSYKSENLRLRSKKIIKDLYNKYPSFKKMLIKLSKIKLS